MVQGSGFEEALHLPHVRCLDIGTSNYSMGVVSHTKTVEQATNGYDGSMLNGLQSLNYWQNYFGHPNSSTLGLMSSMMSIGSICAIPFVPYTADLLGRRTGVLIGCIIMYVYSSLLTRPF